MLVTRCVPTPTTMSASGYTSVPFTVLCQPPLLSLALAAGLPWATPLTITPDVTGRPSAVASGGVTGTREATPSHA